MAKRKQEDEQETDLVEIVLPNGSRASVAPGVAAAFQQLRADDPGPPGEPGDTPVVAGKVLVDYNSVIARAPGQDEIRHVDSPLEYPSLVLQPGLNRLDPEQWNFYGVLDDVGKPGQGKPQLRPLIKKAEVKVLPSLPGNESELKDLILRSRDVDALEWMHEVIAGQKAEYYDHAKNEDRSEILLRLIDKQLSSSNRLEYKSAPYRAPSIHHGKAVTPGLGMGA
jgi:hypothetical protein